LLANVQFQKAFAPPAARAAGFFLAYKHSLLLFVANKNNNVLFIQQR